MAALRGREPEVAASLGLVGADNTFVADGAARSGPLRLAGTRKELLEVTALAPDLVRVSLRPPAAAGDGADVSRTWVASNGERMPGLEGWDRADLARFGELPAVTVTQQRPDAAKSQSAASPPRLKYRIATGALDICLGPQTGLPDLEARHPFQLRWCLPGSSESFAADSLIGAYFYEEGGSATHRMERREGEEFYYGLGEVSGPLNRAGRRFRLEGRDSMGYNAETGDPLYKHFPFYITYNAKHKVAYGILYDHLARGEVDLGQELSAFRGTFRTFRSEAGFVEYYLIFGPSIPEVVEKAGRLVGRPAVPPGWALGYVASTMTYADAPDAQARLEAFPALCEKHDVPCDGFYLSSGYSMDNQGNRNVFTWNLDRVPEPTKMLDAFHNRKMSVLANVKPWLLKAHPEYQKVKKLGGFFRNEKNEALEGWFWKGGPGTFAPGSYLDFSNQDSFNWWKAGLRSSLIEYGVDGIWNDNNEFEVDDSAALCRLEDLPIGKLGRSLHTLLMAKASYEALCEARPKQRPLVVSRSGCLGTSRFAAQTWSGDNTTSFHTMRWNIPMSLGLGLCGWVGNGADIGGFTGKRVTPELLVRWVQVGIYMPRFSIHSSSWKGEASEAGEGGYNLNCTNEPWMFPEFADTIRGLIQLRVQLRPLLLSLHLESSLNSFPVMRPLVFHFCDDVGGASLEESFQFLVGADLMVAPVLDAGETKREVYFPGCAPGTSPEMWCDLHTGSWYQGGNRESVDSPLEGRQYGAPLFLRSGSGLVLGAPGASMEREVILASAPEQQTAIEMAWFEDPTPDQCGRLESPEDMVALDLSALPSADSITITRFVAVQTHPLPFSKVTFRLPPGDTRTLRLAEGLKVPAGVDLIV